MIFLFVETHVNGATLQNYYNYYSLGYGTEILMMG